MTSYLSELKQQNEDFEWYPTTNEIINRMISDIRENNQYYKRDLSFLDIGAGDGKVLNRVRSEMECYSKFLFIEKSQYHNSNMNRDYLLLGTDFHRTSLIHKTVDTIFCNPPYSEYVEWTTRIIKEMDSDSRLYLVIPERWKNNQQIQDVLKSRDAVSEVVGSFSFEDAEDRKARAKVDLVKVKVRKYSTTEDPFYVAFSETFKYPERETYEKEDSKAQNHIVEGSNLIERLCSIYDNRLLTLQENYSKICSLDFDLLSEFELSKKALANSLQDKIESLKKSCWKELFDGMDGINDRLTSNSRKKMLELVNKNTGIEFNRENCYNIVLWVVKNANKYFEDQFLSLYDQLTEYANVDNYKSNKRVFTKDKFRYSNIYYNNEEDSPTHYKLKVGNRIVLERCGGLSKDIWSEWKNGLSERAAEFIGDLLTIASNLGFKVVSERPVAYEWKDNGKKDYFVEIDGRKELLFQVRAFYNSNMHFQFLPEFVHALNIQHGKLRGWINFKEEAERELLTKDDDKKVLDYFDRSIKIEASQLLLT